MEYSDTELIARYNAGNTTVFSVLVLRYVNIVYRYVYRLCKNVQDAEDISQEVFLKVWKNIKKYDSAYAFKTWILHIARNTTIDWLRKKKHIVFSDLEDVFGEDNFTETIIDTELRADEIFAKTEDIKRLNELLEKISLSQREVLLLRYSDDLSFDEIANILNKPVDTVKSLHRRALIAIRKFTNKISEG